MHLRLKANACRHRSTAGQPENLTELKGPAAQEQPPNRGRQPSRNHLCVILRALDARETVEKVGWMGRR